MNNSSSCLPLDFLTASEYIKQCILCCCNDKYFVKCYDGSLTEKTIKQLNILQIQSLIQRQLSYFIETNEIISDKFLCIAFHSISTTKFGCDVDILIAFSESFIELPKRCVILKIHHGNNDTITYHMPEKKSIYTTLCNFQTPLRTPNTLMKDLWTDYNLTHLKKHSKELSKISQDIKYFILENTDFIDVSI